MAGTRKQTMGGETDPTTQIQPEHHDVVREIDTAYT